MPDSLRPDLQEERSSELLRLTPHVETPFLAIDLRELSKNVDSLRSSILDADLWYAMKANPHFRIVQELIRLGVGMEIASESELDLVLKLGLDPSRVMCLHPIKSPVFIARLRAAGVRTMAVDSPEEIKKIARLAPGTEVLIRVDVDLGGKGSRVPLGEKFGCSMSEGIELCRLAHLQGLIPAGVTLHVGSQCESLEHWTRSLADCRGFCRKIGKAGFPPRTISLGGGLPVAYQSSDAVPQWSDIGAIIRATDLASVATPGCRLTIEPGRAIVATTGSMVSTVLGTARRNGKDWVHLDAGIHHGLSEWLPAYGGFRMPILSSTRGNPIRHYRIGGPTCDSIDVLPGEIVLPEVKTGDRVIFHCAGAYSTAISTRFNGFDEPQIVVIDEQGVYSDE